MLYIHDFAGPVPRVSEQLPQWQAFFFENASRPLWYDHPFDIRGNAQFVLLIARGNGVIALYDRKERALVRTFETLPDGDLLRSAYLSADQRFIVQENSDGGFHIHDVMNGQLRLSGRIVDDEVAIWTEDYRFDATADAANLIDLAFAGRSRQYSLDRFAATRRIDGLLQAVLYEGPAVNVPSMQIPPDIAGSITLAGDQIEAAIDVVSGSVTTLSVFQDGVLTDIVPREGSLDGLRVPRLPGARWVSIVATNAQGLASNAQSADLGPSENDRPSQALIVAVNTYNDSEIPSLDFALRDGGRFGEALAEAGNEVTYLGNLNASVEAIRDAVATLAGGLTPGEQGILYFAGHGVQDPSGALYLATSETRLDDLPGTALAFDEISRLLAETEGRITILLDTCHSGAAGQGTFATMDDVVRGLSEVPSNLTILAASKSGELSWEGSEFGGGVFTYALLSVISSDREEHDLDRNGRIEASELVQGVRSIVAAASGDRQTPWLMSSRMVGDYAVF
ncbi:caspase family protein [Pararhodobacter zhoushanensis]|uniref:Caspase family protein n=1 Tax=Pararhodobacter zhoushanensis TaxID=2479545 RepID=A0ABT3H470_9RHOB|nr:caspase family protein [Pararhodobacter zhoushanensis]MCW1934513.1 caspase family protein [Pararhodobacter zhoushanensis]